MDIEKIYHERLALEREYVPKNKVERSLPLVSVCVITFQHRKFIMECLEGILMQETSFPIEIIIGEDGSADGTREICKEYAERYPGIIRLFLRNRETSQLYDENGSFICRFNGKWTRESAKGRYIAICEGDDYWTDPTKLQKQVEFLEKNSGFVVTFHDAKIINEEGIIIEQSKMKDSVKRDFTDKELMTAPPLLTLSLCFRNVLLEMPIENITVENGDNFIISRIGMYGGGKFLANITPSHYRVHKGGIWSLRKKEDKFRARLKTFTSLYNYHRRIGNTEPLASFKKRMRNLNKILFLYYLKTFKIGMATRHFMKYIKNNITWLFSP